MRTTSKRILKILSDYPDDIQKFLPEDKTRYDQDRSEMYSIDALDGNMEIIVNFTGNSVDSVVIDITHNLGITGDSWSLIGEEAKEFAQEVIDIYNGAR